MTCMNSRGRDRANRKELFPFIEQPKIRRLAFKVIGRRIRKERIFVFIHQVWNSMAVSSEPITTLEHDQM